MLKKVSLYLTFLFIAKSYSLSHFAPEVESAPGVVKLMSKYGNAMCTGAIVGFTPPATITVLTAAHCLRNFDDGGLYLAKRGMEDDINSYWDESSFINDNYQRSIKAFYTDNAKKTFSSIIQSAQDEDLYNDIHSVPELFKKRKNQLDTFMQFYEENIQTHTSQKNFLLTIDSQKLSLFLNPFQIRDFLIKNYNSNPTAFTYKINNLLKSKAPEFINNLLMWNQLANGLADTQTELQKRLGVHKAEKTPNKISSNNEDYAFVIFNNVLNGVSNIFHVRDTQSNLISKGHIYEINQMPLVAGGTPMIQLSGGSDRGTAEHIQGLEQSSSIPKSILRINFLNTFFKNSEDALHTQNLNSDLIADLFLIENPDFKKQNSQLAFQVYPGDSGSPIIGPFGIVGVVSMALTEFTLMDDTEHPGFKKYMIKETLISSKANNVKTTKSFADMLNTESAKRLIKEIQHTEILADTHQSIKKDFLSGQYYLIDGKAERTSVDLKDHKPLTFFTDKTQTHTDEITTFKPSIALRTQQNGIIYVTYQVTENTPQYVKVNPEPSSRKLRHDLNPYLFKLKK